MEHVGLREPQLRGVTLPELNDWVIAVLCGHKTRASIHTEVVEKFGLGDVQGRIPEDAREHGTQRSARTAWRWRWRWRNAGLRDTEAGSPILTRSPRASSGQRIRGPDTGSVRVGDGKQAIGRYCHPLIVFAGQPEAYALGAGGPGLVTLGSRYQKRHY